MCCSRAGLESAGGTDIARRHRHAWVPGAPVGPGALHLATIKGAAGVQKGADCAEGGAGGQYAHQSRPWGMRRRHLVNIPAGAAAPTGEQGRE